MKRSTDQPLSIESFGYWLEQFLLYLRAERRSAPRTVETREVDVRQFGAFLREQKTGTAVHRALVRRYLSVLSEQGVAPPTINRKLVSLRLFFDFLVRHNAIQDNPTANLVSLKTAKQLPKFLSPEALLTVLQLPDLSSPYGVRDRAMLEMLYGCGLRRQELIDLDVDAIDFASSEVRVRGKRSRVRVVPLGRAAAQAVASWCQARGRFFHPVDASALFLNAHGERMSATQVYRLVRRYLSQVTGPEKAHPHVFRHSYATHLLDAGADLMAVKELLGHSSLSTTQIYTHVSVGRLKQVYKLAHPRAEVRTPDRGASGQDAQH